MCLTSLPAPSRVVPKWCCHSRDKTKQCHDAAIKAKSQSLQPHHMNQNAIIFHNKTSGYIGSAPDLHRYRYYSSPSSSSYYYVATPLPLLMGSGQKQVHLVYLRPKTGDTKMNLKTHSTSPAGCPKRIVPVFAGQSPGTPEFVCSTRLSTALCRL